MTAIHLKDFYLQVPLRPVQHPAGLISVTFKPLRKTISAKYVHNCENESL